MNNIEMAAYIKQRREALGLSQRQLAEKAGLDRRQKITELESARYDIGLELLNKVLKALDCSLSILTKKQITPKQPAPEVTELPFVWDFKKIKSK